MVDLNHYEASILSILIKNSRFMTTAQIANKTGMSWNTAEIYLKKLHKKGWVERKGKVTGYWKAIVEE